MVHGLTRSALHILHGPARWPDTAQCLARVGEMRVEHEHGGDSFPAVRGREPVLVVLVLLAVVILEELQLLLAMVVCVGDA